MKPSEEDRWEEEYKINKRKRKWLFDKRKASLLNHALSENVKNAVLLVLKIIFFISLTILILCLIKISYNEFLQSQKESTAKSGLPLALTHLDKILSENENTALMDNNVYRGTLYKDTSYLILKDYKVTGELTTINMVPAYDINSIITSEFPTLESQIIRNKFYTMESSGDGGLLKLLCSKMKPEDMESISISGYKIFQHTPDYEKSLISGKVIMGSFQIPSYNLSPQRCAKN